MKKALIVCAIIAALLFAVFVWPTRYRHFTWNGKLPAREGRFTGKVEILYTTGWYEAKPTDKSIFDEAFGQ